jgi:hypothetical protein
MISLISTKMKIEVVKGNSMGNVDNFTGVLNRLAGSEAMSMISARLLYMYIMLSGSYFSF